MLQWLKDVGEYESKLAAGEGDGVGVSGGGCRGEEWEEEEERSQQDEGHWQQHLREWEEKRNQARVEEEKRDSCLDSGSTMEESIGSTTTAVVVETTGTETETYAEGGGGGVTREKSTKDTGHTRRYRMPLSFSLKSLPSKPEVVPVSVMV